MSILKSISFLVQVVLCHIKYLQITVSIVAIIIVVLCKIIKVVLNIIVITQTRAEILDIVLCRKLFEWKNLAFILTVKYTSL